MTVPFFALNVFLAFVIGATSVRSSSLSVAGRKELQSVSPFTPISNLKPGQSSEVNNLPLWQKRAKIRTTVGYMTVPSVHAPAKFVTYAERARDLEKSANSGSIKPESIIGCNTGFPVANVSAGAEDSGRESGIVSLLTWNNGGWFTSCSGSLLNSKLVVTAAHCVFDTEKDEWMVSRHKPMLVFAGLNGKNDSKFQSAFATRAVMFTAYRNKIRWSASLLDNSDIAVLFLNGELSGNAFRWSAPLLTITPRRSYGYSDGVTLSYDVSTLKANNPICQRRKYSNKLICDNVYSEGGMGGGPMIELKNATQIGTQIGVCSGGNGGQCPSFYTSLTGIPFAVLVTHFNCTISNSTSGGRTFFSASC